MNPVSTKVASIQAQDAREPVQQSTQGAGMQDVFSQLMASMSIGVPPMETLPLALKGEGGGRSAPSLAADIILDGKGLPPESAPVDLSLLGLPVNLLPLQSQLQSGYRPGPEAADLSGGRNGQPGADPFLTGSGELEARRDKALTPAAAGGDFSSLLDAGRPGKQGLPDTLLDAGKIGNQGLSDSLLDSGKAASQDLLDGTGQVIPQAVLNGVSTGLPATARSPADAGILPDHVGTPAWSQGLEQKVVWMLGRQEQHVSLQLNPPQLGPLEIHLHIKDDQATALFVSSHGAVREAIENSMSRLRDNFQDQGINLSGSCLSQNPGEQFAGHERSAQQSGHAAHRAAGNADVGEEIVSTTGQVSSTVRGEGLVNLFA